MIDKKSKNRRGYVDLDPWLSMPAPLFPTSMIFFIGCVGYACNTRDIVDFVHTAGIPALLVTFIIFFVGLQTFRDANNKAQRWAGIITMAGSPLTAGVITAFYFCIVVSLWDTFWWLYARWTLQIGSIMATSAVTLISGTLLFYVRFKARTLYGLTEAIAGISIASFKFLETGTNAFLQPNFYLVILTAGVYLVVRGLDNMHQGIVREPIDPYATQLVKWWNTLGLRIDSHNSTPRLNGPARAQLKAMRERTRRKRGSSFSGLRSR